MKRLWLSLAAAALICMVVAALVLLLPKPPIPRDIQNQVTSTVMVPQHTDVKLDRESVKYDGKLKLLTFNLKAFNIPMVVSEQPTPESFTDIPQVYDKVVTGMNEYSKFEVDIGTVHLTRPPELHGKQAAVLNTKGTLLFAKPRQDLSSDQWRKFFGSFEVEK